MITRPSEAQEELSWGVSLSLLEPAMYDDLVQFWKRQNITINPTSEVEVATFEASYGFRLPEDFRQYLLETSGTGPYGDRENFEFYPLNRLALWSDAPWNKSSTTYMPSNFRQEDFLIFGDYLAICWAYAIRIKGHVDDVGEIVHWGMGAYSPICRNFRTFIDLYLADDQRLYRIRTSS